MIFDGEPQAGLHKLNVAQDRALGDFDLLGQSRTVGKFGVFELFMDQEHPLQRRAGEKFRGGRRALGGGHK